MANVGSDLNGNMPVDERTWIDKLERGIIVASRAFAMVVWGVVGAPVWAILICFALLFVIVVTVARALTWREFSMDRRLLSAVIRFYPNGLRSLKTEFAKINQAIEESEEDTHVESSYFFSTFQAVGVLIILLALYCLYARIDLWTVPTYFYVAISLILVVLFIMAIAADVRKRGQPVVYQQDSSEPT